MAKMKKMKKAVFALPSLVTLCSVFCAFVSMAWSLQAQTLMGQARLDLIFNAALAIIFSIIFDTFDGKVARATHTSTKFGMELDSLADATSFGVAPAVLLYGFALSDCGWFGIIAAFLFAAGPILRLARFNVEAPDEGVQTFFKGIPSPAIVFGRLMISTLKFKTFKGEKTKADYIFVALGVSMFIALCFIYHPTIAFFFLLCYYLSYGILYTMVWNLRHMKPHGRRRRRKPSMSITDMPAAEISASENDADKLASPAENASDKSDDKIDDSDALKS